MNWSLSFEPRAWQRAALKRWVQSERGVVSVVTGGGKTAFAQLCMLEFAKRNSSAVFFIVVPSLALLDQWYVSLLEDLHVSEQDIACFSSQEKAKRLARVNIAVINTARSLASRIKSAAPMCLIVDECHRAGSAENSKIFSIKTAASLGLSATPIRDSDEGFERLIQPALGPVIYDYPYEQAARDGVITPFDLVNVRFDLGSVSGGRVAREKATAKVLDSWRVPLAVHLCEKHATDRVIVFHESVTAANQIHSLLSHRAKSVTVYHSGISPFVRRDNLRLFKKGVYDILVCCRALDEGINVPDANVGILAKSTSSTRQRIQRLGRILRRHSKKNRAHIYTLYQGAQEELRLRSEEQRLTGVAQVKWVSGRLK